MIRRVTSSDAVPNEMLNSAIDNAPTPSIGSVTAGGFHCPCKQRQSRIAMRFVVACAIVGIQRLPPFIAAYARKIPTPNAKNTV